MRLFTLKFRRKAREMELKLFTSLEKLNIIQIHNVTTFGPVAVVSKMVVTLVNLSKSGR